MATRIDDERVEALGSGCAVLISPDHGFGTDALLLANFAAPKQNAPCIDLGTGCGIIPMLWKRNGVTADIYGLELQEKGFDQFWRAISLCEEQGLSMDNVHALCGDLRDLDPLNLPLGTFKTVTMNPPYKPVDSGILSETATDRIARHETTCTMDDASAAAERLLNFGGELYRLSTSGTPSGRSGGVPSPFHRTKASALCTKECPYAALALPPGRPKRRKAIPKGTATPADAKR